MVKGSGSFLGDSTDLEMTDLDFVNIEVGNRAAEDSPSIEK